MKEALLENMVLAGGTTMMSEFQERVEQDFCKIFNQSSEAKEKNFQVIAERTRMNAAWVGGSILSSMATFSDIAISKNDYEEKGEHRISLALEKTF